MNYGFETRCIHGNGTDEKTHSYGSVAVPIYQAATFCGRYCSMRKRYGCGRSLSGVI